MKTANDVTIHARSSQFDAAAVQCVVTLPTFRRPEHLIETLNSIARQQSAPPFAIIIMENDAEGMAGADAAINWLKDAPCPGLVVVAHNRGNCHAYNAGWETALAEFPSFTHIAVIDDDELASPEWLSHLFATAGQTGAELTGAPQVPVFDDPELDSWARHPAFSPHYTETGTVPILYSSGNVLIARKVLEAMPRPFLDPSFNFIGGGDSDFYRRCRNAGFGFAWCKEAPVMETVPTRRTEFSWLNARSLRNGAISAILERRQSSGLLARAKILIKSLILLALSPFRGFGLLVKTGSPVISLYHAQVAIGRLMAEIGMVNEQYRNPEAN